MDVEVDWDNLWTDKPIIVRINIGDFSYIDCIINPPTKEIFYFRGRKITKVMEAIRIWEEKYDCSYDSYDGVDFELEKEQEPSVIGDLLGNPKIALKAKDYAKLLKKVKKTKKEA